jgi:hypothetical protein
MTPVVFLLVLTWHLTKFTNVLMKFDFKDEIIFLYTTGAFELAFIRREAICNLR